MRNFRNTHAARIMSTKTILDLGQAPSGPTQLAAIWTPRRFLRRCQGRVNSALRGFPLLRTVFKMRQHFSFVEAEEAVLIVSNLMDVHVVVSRLNAFLDLFDVTLWIRAAHDGFSNCVLSDEF